mmetsp:Transcript_4029/g.9192  ORF Transcript_4029/g.9192 Transcript_4029/m.9192 type:complete len:231 (-) Transcript_4029:66-758(-)|eukprot:CAMPEP_0172039360 /NCGR_PEP_ID=MMETSP1041-20130122/23858_1 /TAXON_ID=464988 /ORGANISM="Hemiselmis andersenii, Strain CCMP439" /LENGTH=230 /DNA_ID=CAMNT_0012697055 /DNA_START=296 /DNA_END=988 /DNA_ORIENTATION=+
MGRGGTACAPAKPRVSLEPCSPSGLSTTASCTPSNSGLARSRSSVLRASAYTVCGATATLISTSAGSSRRPWGSSKTLCTSAESEPYPCPPWLLEIPFFAHSERVEEEEPPDDLAAMGAPAGSVLWAFMSECIAEFVVGGCCWKADIVGGCGTSNALPAVTSPDLAVFPGLSNAEKLLAGEPTVTICVAPASEEKVGFGCVGGAVLTSELVALELVHELAHLPLWKAPRM